MEECQEFIPNDILKHFKNHPLVRECLNRENLSVLDIGCSDSIILFCLHHELNFKNLVGVEKLPEDYVVAKYVEKSKENFIKAKGIEDTSSKSAFDIYKNYLTPPPGQHHLNESDFEKVFRLRYDTSAEKYLAFLEDKFDYVILSHVLHWLEKDHKNFVFNEAVARLKPGGMLYVKVNHTDFTPSGYNETDFSNLFSNFEKIYSCKSLLPDGRIRHMIYFGVKK